MRKGQMAVALAVLGVASMAQASQYMVNFALNATGAVTGSNWNNVLGSTNVLQGPNDPQVYSQTLIDFNTAVAGPTLNFDKSRPFISVNVTTPTNPTTYGTDANTAGTNAPAGAALAAGFVSPATTQSFYGVTSSWNGQPTGAPNPEIAITGLDPSSAYTFTIFASRTGVGDIRSTLYQAFGATGSSGYAVLDAANNTSNVVTISSILPDATGKILFDVNKHTAGDIAGIGTVPANTNGAGYFYLTALRIDSAAVPEPASLGLLGLGTLALLRRRRA